VRVRPPSKGPTLTTSGWGTLIFIVLSVLVCGTLTSCGPPHPNHPVIGAKNFTEQVVLGELLAQQIEAKTGMKVERRFYLAGSYICNQALISGRIDAYVEYTGTALTAILKQPVNRDPEAVLHTVRNLYQQRDHITVMDPLGFENTFAMIIRGDDVARYREPAAVITIAAVAVVARSIEIHLAVLLRDRNDCGVLRLLAHLDVALGARQCPQQIEFAH